MYLCNRTLNTGEGIQGKNEERLNKESVREPTLSPEKKQYSGTPLPDFLPSPLSFFSNLVFFFLFFHLLFSKFILGAINVLFLSTFLTFPLL